MKFNHAEQIKTPLVSIITVVLNGEKYLEETILSIVNQKYKNIEYIVVDGGSVDGTLKIIHKYKKFISKFVSEKDEGIYYAFNKGLALSTGDLIGFVNADDILLEDALEILVRYYKNNPSADFVFGSVKKHWGILHGYKPKKINYSWGFYSSHSTGFFIKRDSAVKVGFYNTKYKYHADYDYFYRAIVTHKLKGLATKKSEVFGIFRRGGFSSKINFLSRLFEEITIRIDNKQNKYFILLLFIHKFIKNINKIY
jgi:glycosyltransferase involved in cell wall biosynthesis